MVIIIIPLVCGCSNENRRKENNADVLLEEVENLVEQSSQREKVFDENLNEYTVELEEIPELAYGSVSELNSGDNYICYKDILILGNTIYKKEAGKYVKQKATLNTIFDIEDELAVEAKQYKNLIITVSDDDTSFLIYDMETHAEYCFYGFAKDVKIGPFWYVYDGCIYYSKYKMANPIEKIDLLSRENVEVLQAVNEEGEECNIRVYGIRSDGAIMYEISNEISSREYWIAKSDGNGAWSKRKIWETNNWKFAHILDFNQYGLIIFGKSNSSSDCETIVIKDDGEIIRLDENLTYGKYLFMDNGYFSSNLAKLEHMPWEDDSVESELFSRNLADSISFYDYAGNKLITCAMINKNLLEQGFYLKKITYHDTKLTGFYVQRETKELYISQINIDTNYGTTISGFMQGSSDNT